MPVCEPLSRTELWQQPPRSHFATAVPPAGLANGALPRGHQAPRVLAEVACLNIVGCVRISIDFNVT